MKILTLQELLTYAETLPADTKIDINSKDQ